MSWAILKLAYAALWCEARQAIDFAEQRLEIAREIGDQRGEGAALGNLGSAYAVLGEGGGRRLTSTSKLW